ncbi:hypothetical protein GJ496_007350 [Pomphorhynchus laevis]|nr:hypothetical protein GJ496_007350 [Pomphorhynchus laevis]
MDDSALLFGQKTNQPTSKETVPNEATLKRRNTSPVDMPSYPAKRVRLQAYQFTHLQSSACFVKASTKNLKWPVTDNDLKDEDTNKSDIISNLWIHDLHDVLNTILRRISPIDRTNMSLVSKRWNKVISYINDANKRRSNFLKKIAIMNEECKENCPDSKHFISKNTRSQTKKLADKKASMSPCSFNVENGPFKESPRSPTKLCSGPRLSSFIRCFDQIPEKIEGHDYTNMPCPNCRRTCLVDVKYHRGKCLYAKCRFIFCSLCEEQYHPLPLCPERTSFKFNLEKDKSVTNSSPIRM